MDTILFALWYLLPAGVGNMTPVFMSKTPGLNNWCTPMDGGKTWRGKRIFGPHKTIRGFVFGVLSGLLVGLLQIAFHDPVGQIITLPPDLYNGSTPVLLGGLLAAGALLGDAIESFVKRQMGVASGDSWFPFDQMDYIIGACLLAAIIMPLTLYQYAVILLLWFVLHIVSSYIGYMFKLKSKPI